MRRAGSGATWTSGGAGGGAKQKGENDGAVRIRTKGSTVEVIIIDEAEQRKQEMRSHFCAQRAATCTSALQDLGLRVRGPPAMVAAPGETRRPPAAAPRGMYRIELKTPPDVFS